MAKLGAECTESRSLLPLLVRSTVAALMRLNAAVTSRIVTLAAIGREDGTPYPTEKLNAELFLQQLHLMTDGRGRQVQFVRRSDETAPPDGGLEGFERVE